MRTVLLKVILIAIVAGAFGLVITWTATPAWADWWLGDDYKMHYPQTPKPGGWDVEFSSSRLADDWMCSETGPVSDIRFWISWMDDMVQPIDDIRIGIWSNDPSGPLGWSVPDILLWERIFTSSDITIVEWEPDLQGWYDPSSGSFMPDNHLRRFQINIEEIQDPYIQEEDVIYWLEIDFGPLPFVGWKETDQHWNDDAVFWYSPFWWEVRDPIEGTSIDLAFVITGYCCNDDGMRGDVDNSGGGPNIADVVYLVKFIFFGGPPPPCFEEGDVDGSGSINIADAVHLVQFIFFGGPPPAPCP
ncbi:MAG: hypothetical protein E3J26_05575 [Candidatus Zixiibacteriota bacterium]|nr:MAG: hypothetical protein E3J26_05575 [candidate division Zixibacteria bacterium]